jgi:hypothetical protein
VLQALVNQHASSQIVIDTSPRNGQVAQTEIADDKSVEFDIGEAAAGGDGMQNPI